MIIPKDQTPEEVASLEETITNNQLLKIVSGLTTYFFYFDDSLQQQECRFILDNKLYVYILRPYISFWDRKHSSFEANK